MDFFTELWEKEMITIKHYYYFVTQLLGNEYNYIPIQHVQT